MGNKRDHEKRPEAVEMWFWGGMKRMSWVENMLKEEVLEKVGMEKELLNAIKRRQWI